MEQEGKSRKLAGQIKALFKMGPVVLILGKDCETELQDQLLKLEWNCIITSSRQSDLAAKFTIENKRMPVNILEPEGIEKLGSRIIDRRNLPIIRLYGVEGRDNEEDKNLTERARRVLRKSNARKMLDYLPGIIDKQFGWVIIAGYDPADSEDIDQDDLYSALHDLGQPIVRFFGLVEEQVNNSSVRDLVRENLAKVYSESINEILAMDQSSEEEILYDQNIQGKTIFIDGRAINVDNELTFETEGFAQLLTVEDVRRVVLRKKGEQIQWFYNFLKLSAEKPQWYGYNPISDFHLTRFFEADLVRMVEAQLSNRHLPDRVRDTAGNGSRKSISKFETDSGEDADDKLDATSEKKAILLSGHPCSSKTITLGALAYKVFDSKKYPVVFIRSADINLSQNSVAFAALDKLLENLENLGTSSVLLIWDCSSYNNLGNSVCRNLNDALLNRGRKVVLVCSSYEQPKDFYATERDYTEDGSIKQVKNFYVIKATQELIESECIKLKNLVAEKSGINRGSLEAFWNNPKNSSNNLLTRLYTMLYELHPQLEFGLNREYNTSIGSIKEILSSMPPMEREKTSMELAFEKKNKELGIIAEPEALNLNWEKFTATIAIFSRFKLDTPVSMAMHALNLPMNSSNAKIYQRVMDMPWLSYHTSPAYEYSGDYMFSFRSPLEAEIYLNISNIDAATQVDYIVELLEYVGEANRNSKVQTSLSSQVLENIIRIIGPNTSNMQFTQGSLRSEYNAFKAAYPKLIEAMKKLREKYNYEDPKLINQEVTFIREYYYNIWEDFHPNTSDIEDNIANYIERIEKINGAIITANGAIEGLHDQIRNANRGISNDKNIYFYQLGLRNSLIVECVFCDLKVRELRHRVKEQLRLMGKNEDEISDVIAEAKVKVEPFAIVKDRLMDVIYTNPTSSYAYNALFSKFLAEYEDNQLTSLEKLRYLSEMKSLIAEVNNINRDMMLENEEYSRKALSIENLTAKNVDGVTIYNIDLPDDQFTGVSSQFRKYYNTLLEERNGCGIYLLADNAMKEADIDYRKPLNSTQKDMCRDIIEFLTRPDYADAVQQNAGCQYMLLRLKWMLYNGMPIFSGRERQLTRMNLNQWREIAGICKSYAENFLKNGKTNYNAATIYYLIALCSAQLGDYPGSSQAFHKISEENFYSQIRNKTWHILCNEDGEPYNFTGEFEEDKFNIQKRSGKAYISGISKSREDTIYYYLPNLGWSSVHPGTHKDLEVGISFIGFSIFRAAGRANRQ